MTTVVELAARLTSALPGVRRIAVHDLIRRGDPAALQVLADHAPIETDERAALLIVRHLSGIADSREALLRVYESPLVPACAAVEAIRAADARSARDP